MKKNSYLCAALCGLMSLSSCTEEVMNLKAEAPGTSLLQIRTRGDGDQIQGRIYVFSGNKCVQVLSADENQRYVTTTLSPSTYDLYAVGSDDLSRFDLPDLANASFTAPITLKEGQTMPDLLLGRGKVTLEDGKTTTADVTLNRKVLKITDIKISKVPTDIEQVTVTISPFYQTYLLGDAYRHPNGTFTTSLTNAGDGLWQATPNVINYPSVGKPNITIIFTKGASQQAFTYTGTAELTANHEVVIEGTYTEQQGITLQATLLSETWGEANNLAFNFNSANDITGQPVAGQLYNGYYVLSADYTLRRVTLLSKEDVTYEVPAADYREYDLWLTYLNNAMAAYPKPEGALDTDVWRLPTSAECEVFTQATDYITPASETNSLAYFHLFKSYPYWGATIFSPTLSFTSGRNFSESTRLRPVIEIPF